MSKYLDSYPATELNVTLTGRIEFEKYNNTQ